ncbi:hypothetical protein ZIOFF_060339 [Zingiber officinale]|uniref:RING-type E3 ubiquitin transferase n=1 Tax=Zingiber officinale TaxID=94328 RepID=A0A8J5F6F4_ZINOF|nr:hypothetical protein ZIOFF_060339 [Zingiber officinale]
MNSLLVFYEAFVFGLKLSPMRMHIIAGKKALQATPVAIGCLFKLYFELMLVQNNLKVMLLINVIELVFEINYYTFPVVMKKLKCYIALFQRGVHAATSSVQERITFVSQAPTVDDSIPDTYQSPPRPIPYDDPRFSRPHHGVMSNNKFLSHYHEESESCRSNNVCETESSRMESKSKSDFDSRSKFCIPESSLKNTAEARKEVTYLFPSSEEEDVCPTCLEVEHTRDVLFELSLLLLEFVIARHLIDMISAEYTSEDPKIIMQCSHHFHLGCIYEWMERSEACPVCGKVTSLCYE